MPDVKIFAKTIEDSAKKQIDELVSLAPFRDCKIRIMPDVHAGAGCVIGFTADLGNKVIPNIVGVDIGCGMQTIILGKVDIDLDKLDRVIHDYIPAGMDVHDEETIGMTGIALEDLRCFFHLRNKDRLCRSAGTLGGGNHFIEVDKDDEGNKYLIIHTGSRNLGKQVADIYQKKAIEYCGKMVSKPEIEAAIFALKQEGRQREIPQAIKDVKRKYENYTDIPKALCFLEGDDREDYLHDMLVCQRFAQRNRSMISRNILVHMGMHGIDGFETVHNYVDIYYRFPSQEYIVRKGAVSAKLGQELLIPINMRDGCIIGRGKGNPDWNWSAPHGAGRIMSRMKAKETLSLDDYRKSMDGIFTTSVSESTIDEAPQVYKPLDEIAECIADTVEIEKIIKPIYNFKAGSDD